ncbi:MAG: PSD1 and planctomycete cytochrome C domain-containing protein [Bryobacteraceae bacterium]
MFFRAIAALIVTAASALPATNPEIFARRLQPLLSEKCASCHTVSGAAGGLSVAGLDDLLTGGKHGAAITPGDSAHSLLIQYLRGEKTPKMPMGGSLPEAKIAEVAAAIDEMKGVPQADSAKQAYLNWLLHKPVAPAVPSVENSAWVVNPVDAFVLGKLEAAGLKTAAPADRRTLIRRVYLDVIGIPPSPEEVQSFVDDQTPGAYEKIVNKLLDDPRYGERWGRHWLDLVRFAESDGFAIDGERPTAWRYRDYVIRAFNKDKPYDLFVKEQIAGDEMGGKQSKPEERSERLIALGYLRMATWEADANFKTQLRQDFLNDVTATTAQVFLGFTAGCARCHDHKYDPIPQKDFYRMQAFFAATKPDERPAPFTPSEDPQHRMKQLARQYEDQADEAGERFNQVEKEMKSKYVAARNLKSDDKNAEDFRKALKDVKDPAYTADDRARYAAVRDEARRFADAAPRYRPMAYAVSDVVPPQVPVVADTYLLLGGELANKGEKVEPGFLQCVVGKNEPAKIPFSGGSSGRRLALAEWIANPDNPLTARVMVNRIWQHHFGEGLVRTPSDWGMNGDRPSHPELLDWLAAQFVEKKWSVKAMHRLMLLSNAYQQASETPEFAAFAKKDPDNRLLWHANWQRLEAEVLRDSILQAGGRLQKAGGGPGVFLDIPADVADGFEFFKWFPSDEKDQLRRTIYTFQRRSVMMPIVEVFDGANMNESCARRNVTTVPTQAFSLLNSEFANREARHFADRVIEFAGPDRTKQIDRAFLVALDRQPTDGERKKAAAVLGDLPAQEALTRLGVVLFNLNEFVYVN